MSRAVFDPRVMAVLDPVNVERLRKRSLVFLLQAGEEIIARRIGGSDRPSLTGKPPAEEVGELLRERQPAYLRSADFCIGTEGRSPAGVAGEILRILKEGPTSSLSRQAGMQFLGKIPLPAGDRSTVSRMPGGRAAPVMMRAAVPGIMDIADSGCTSPAWISATTSNSEGTWRIEPAHRA